MDTQWQLHVPFRTNFHSNKCKEEAATAYGVQREKNHLLFAWGSRGVGQIKRSYKITLRISSFVTNLSNFLIILQLWFCYNAMLTHWKSFMCFQRSGVKKTTSKWNILAACPQLKSWLKDWWQWHTLLNNMSFNYI